MEALLERWKAAAEAKLEAAAKAAEADVNLSGIEADIKTLIGVASGVSAILAEVKRGLDYATPYLPAEDAQVAAVMSAAQVAIVTGQAAAAEADTILAKIGSAL